MPGGGSAALLAGHRRDQFTLGEVGDRGGQDMAGVAVDGDRGAQFVHLLQMVGDEEERHSLALQFPELVEEPPDAPGVELGGRLVEDDQPRAEGQRAGDLDELPLLDSEIARPGIRVDLDAVVGEELLRALAQPPPADPAGVVVEPVEEEVLGDGQVGDDHGLLVDAGDLRLPGRGVPEGGRGLPAERDRPGVRLVESGQDADQRRLARTVAADEGVRLTGLHGELHPVERNGRSEAFDNAFRLYGGWWCLVHD